ncbi:MAG: DUF5686 and carboxypeptidase regulatory-like domain-containing protein [Ekhidna sp.]
MRFSLYALLISFSFFSIGQSGIKGFTKSQTGELLPFATVYVKGTTNGTTSNASGEFYLKLQPGTYTIVAQYVGYFSQEKRVEVRSGEPQKNSFVLREQALQLQTVVVTADDENPAHRIIRGAIRKRKFYENEVKAFKNDAYIKGLFRLDKRPDKILGQDITIDTGIVYLSESVSQFSFERPDKVREVMISSKVSGNEQGFSFNQASDFNINIYDKNYTNDILGERVFISPISPQAFLYYDYEWLGFFEENGKLINKIKLLPKRSTDPVFEGEIYIVENDWKFHSVDFLATKERGIEFTDSLRINQVYTSTDFDIWMPISQKFEFQFGGFGFKGSGYFIGIYSNYQVEPNYELFEEKGIYDSVFQDEVKKNLFTEEDFGNEILKVEKESNERDSTYWKKIRPLPLTKFEVIDYQTKDSIRLVKESRPYRDSVDTETNKLTVGNILLTGYSHANSFKEIYWNLPAITSMLQFNTVEGLVTEFQPTYYKQVDERTKFWIRPSARYGFSNERFNAKLEASYRKLDDKFTRFYVGGGRYTSQFDETNAIPVFVNSYVTLISGDNYLKIFEKSFGYFRFFQEIRNGLTMNARVEYASRNPLINTTDYTWAKEENFTSNEPRNNELLDNTRFDQHQALFTTLDFRIRFGQKYATRPDRKLIYSSKYPEVHVKYKRGWETLGSDVNYDFVRIMVTDDVRLGLIGQSNYSIAIGGFLNRKSLTFVDYHHFTGNQTSLSQVNGELKFELLPFYIYSTTNAYLETHFEHHFNEFIFNKIPLIKKLNLQAVASINYLKTDSVGDYFELGAGIEHIFKFMRVDYWWGIGRDELTRQGFRLGIGF